MLALDRKGLQLFVIHWDVGVLGVFVAAALGLALDRLSRDIVDQLLAQAVAGLLVDLAERDPLGRCCPGVDGDRTRDQRKLEMASPKWTRGSHGYLRFCWRHVGTGRVYGPPCSEKRRLARANPSMPASVR